MKLVKRKAMTLIELLIGMSLTLILLSILGAFFREISLLDARSEKLQTENFQQRYLESRLAMIIPYILPEYKVQGRPCHHFYFFTSDDLDGLLAKNNPSLVFIYDSGADPDNNRSGCSLARLYLDTNHQLCLASWPVFKDWNLSVPAYTRKEVLFTGVESIQFDFFVAPKKDRKALSTKKKPLKEEHPIGYPVVSEGKSDWVSIWLPEYQHLPSMMKIRLTLQRRNPIDNKPIELTLAYQLPYSQQLIVYEE